MFFFRAQEEDSLSQMGNCFFARFPEHDFENEILISSCDGRGEGEEENTILFPQWKMLEGYKQGAI